MYSVAQIDGLNNQFLPPFITMQPTQAQQQRQSKKPQEQQEGSTCMAVLQGQWGRDGCKGKQGNGFWIAVSGFQPDRAGLVYCFFADIGHIVQSIVTGSSTIHLKYFCATDCKTALSYDNQRVGYGADIHVRVKLEQPGDKLKIDTTRHLKRQPEAEPMEEQSAPVTDIATPCTNVEVCPETELQPEPKPEPKPEPEPEPEPEPKQEPKQEMEPKNQQRRARPRRSALPWLLHKLSYIFFF